MSGFFFYPQFPLGLYLVCHPGILLNRRGTKEAVSSRFVLRKDDFGILVNHIFFSVIKYFMFSVGDVKLAIFKLYIFFL